MRAVAVAVAAPAVALALAPAALACPKTSLGEVEKEVMCPVCGTPLALATEPPQAKRQRALIERLVGQCKSKEEVKVALAAEFGDEVLAMPKERGFNLAAYLVPVLALLAAAGAIAAAALRWRRLRARTAGPDVAAAEPPPPDRAGSERLEADLERYEL